MRLCKKELCDTDMYDEKAHCHGGLHHCCGQVTTARLPQPRLGRVSGQRKRAPISVSAHPPCFSFHPNLTFGSPIPQYPSIHLSIHPSIHTCIQTSTPCKAHNRDIYFHPRATDTGERAPRVSNVALCHVSLTSFLATVSHVVVAYMTPGFFTNSC